MSCFSSDRNCQTFPVTLYGPKYHMLTLDQPSIFFPTTSIVIFNTWISLSLVLPLYNILTNRCLEVCMKSMEYLALSILNRCHLVIGKVTSRYTMYVKILKILNVRVFHMSSVVILKVPMLIWGKDKSHKLNIKEHLTVKR